MSDKELADYILNLLEILTKWPLILLFILFIFREQIKGILLELTQRILKISFGKTTLDFTEVQSLAAKYDPDLLKQILLGLRSSSLSEGETEYSEEELIEDELIEIEDEDSVDHNDINDFQNEFNKIKNR